MDSLYAQIATGLILILLGTLFWMYSKYTKLQGRYGAMLKEKDKEVYDAELSRQSLILAMNPHFLFNALNSIQRFFSHVRNRPFNDFISQLAEFIRLSIDTAKNGDSSLEQEKRRLELYVKLEMTRLQHPLNFDIEIDDVLLNEGIRVPGLLLQPIVDVVIWEGIAPAEQEGYLRIAMKALDQGMQIEVAYNGIGLHSIKKGKGSEKVDKAFTLTESRLLHISLKNSFSCRNLETTQNFHYSNSISLFLTELD